MSEAQRSPLKGWRPLESVPAAAPTALPKESGGDGGEPMTAATEARPTVTARGEMDLGGYLGPDRTGGIDPQIYIGVAATLKQAQLGNVELGKLEVVFHPKIDADALKCLGWRIEKPQSLEPGFEEVVEEADTGSEPKPDEAGALRLRHMATGRDLTFEAEEMQGDGWKKAYRLKVFLGPAPGQGT